MEVIKEMAEKRVCGVARPVGIALGSNLGNSQQILNQVINKLKNLHKGPVSSFLQSSFYKTAPVDCPPGSPDFLNAVIQLETEHSASLLLKLLQNLEIASGRSSPYAKNAPRTLDLDLLYCNSLTLSLPELIVPHPRIRERLFVLMPLAEILPNIILPGWEKTAQEYLHDINKI